MTLPAAGSRRNFVLGGALALAGCQRSVQGYFGDTTPPGTNRLVFESGSEPGSLDPALCIADAETFVLAALFEGLTALHPITAEPMAALATHYQVSEDGTQFTFYLRGHPAAGGIRLPGVSELPDEYRRGHAGAPDNAAALWSDGSKITAEDFVYSWKRVKDPATAAELAPVYFAGIHSAHAVDEFTLQVKLSQPNAVFLKCLWLPVFAAVPRHAIEAVQAAGRQISWTDPRHMICSGPFVLSEWLPRDKIVLRRNPRYYEAGLVSLDELVFLPTVSGATAMNLYKSGDVHVTDVRSIPQVYVPIVAAARDARRSPGCCTEWLSLNTTQSPLDQVETRYALSMAVDRAAIARTLGAGRVAARGLVPPVPGYDPPTEIPFDRNGQTCDLLSFNPEAARALIAAGNHTNPLRISCTFPEGASMKELGQIVAQQWRSILNIECSLNVQERSVYWTQTCLKRSYQGVVLDEWRALVADPYDFLLQFGPAQYACAAWSDSHYDTILAGANSILNPVERLRELAEVEKYLLRQMPIIPLYYDSWLSLQKPYVRGIPLNHLGWPGFKYAMIDTHWTPEKG